MAIMTIPRPLQITTSDIDNACFQEFGTILSRDEIFYEMQSHYCRYAKITEDRGVTVIDISKVPKLSQMNNDFYVSSKEPLESFAGCIVNAYEEKNGFWTYRITPLTNVMRFDNV